ncbi:hypothetical protein C3513_26195 [Salmonella enterica]|nr:hypothetical protein [Salmonella enterica]
MIGILPLSALMVLLHPILHQTPEPILFIQQAHGFAADSKSLVLCTIDRIGIVYNTSTLFHLFHVFV